MTLRDGSGTILTMTVSLVVGVILGYAIARSTGLVGGGGGGSRQTGAAQIVGPSKGGLPLLLMDGPDPGKLYLYI